MPKQKINVNENLDVSIGDIIKPKDKEPEYFEEISKGRIYENTSISSEKLSKPNIKNPPAEIKELIPKIGKISLQKERAGRGGRTVTIITIGETRSEIKQNLEALLKELKKSLGCGGQIEEGKIVLHGEIADRAYEWFVKMGAKAVKNHAK
jgi:translation initiation factor 1 (eIF-1/SUI1)